MKLKDVEVGQAFVFSETIYLLIDKSGTWLRDNTGYYALRLSDSKHMGKAFQIASFGDGDSEVELYEPA